MDDRQKPIVIEGPRCLLVFTWFELVDLLRSRPDLMAEALRRGKKYVRAERESKRKPK